MFLNIPWRKASPADAQYTSLSQSSGPSSETLHGSSEDVELGVKLTNLPSPSGPSDPQPGSSGVATIPSAPTVPSLGSMALSHANTAAAHAFLAVCVALWCMIVSSFATIVLCFFGYLALNDAPRYEPLVGNDGFSASMAGEAVCGCVLALGALVRHVVVKAREGERELTEYERRWGSRTTEKKTGLADGVSKEVTLAAVMAGLVAPALGVAIVGVEGLRAVDALVVCLAGLGVLVVSASLPLLVIFLVHKIGLC